MHNARCRVAENLQNMAGVKLLDNVGSTSLFSPTTSLYLLNETEINNMLNKQCWTQPSFDMACNPGTILSRHHVAEFVREKCQV